MNNIIYKNYKTEYDEDIKNLPIWEPVQDRESFKKILEIFSSEGFSEDECKKLTSDTAKLLGKCIDPKTRELNYFRSTGLVIGEIQSGKTSSMEAVTAMAKDNKYRIVIVLSGSIGSLANQTLERFKALRGYGWFRPDIDSHNSVEQSNKIVSRLKEWDTDIDEDDKQTILIVSWKNPSRIQKLINIISDVKNNFSTNFPVLIIDDECDHHSLTPIRSARSNNNREIGGRRSTGQNTYTAQTNTTLEAISEEEVLNIDELQFLNPDLKSKNIRVGDTIIIESQESATHRSIKDLRRNLSCHTYLGYTGTPIANTLIRTVDHLTPNFAHILNAGEKYIGLTEVFSNRENTKKFVRDIPYSELDNLIEENEKPASLDKAIRIFLIGVANGYYNKEPHRSKKRSMIVHTSHLTKQGNESHSNFYGFVKDTIESMKEIFDSEGSDFEEGGLQNELIEFENEHKELKSTEASLIDFQTLKDGGYIQRAINKMVIIEFNGSDRRRIGDLIDWDDDGTYSRILVGGMGLDRGYTVKGLTVTYMSREARTITKDTLMQRARFFGYHLSYSGLIRIFLTDGLKDSYKIFFEITHQMIEGTNGIRNFLKENIDFKYWKRHFKAHGIGGVNLTKESVIALNLKNFTKHSVIQQTSPHLLEDNPDLNINREIFKKINQINNFKLFQDVDFISNNFSWAQKESNHSGKDFKLIDHLKMSDVYNSFLINLNNHETDIDKFINLNSMILEFLKKTDPICPIIVMNRNIREITAGDTIQPFVGTDNSNYPGDRKIHYEFLAGYNRDPLPKTIPSLQIYSYDLTINQKLKYSKVPIFIFYPCSEMWLSSKLYS